MPLLAAQPVQRRVGVGQRLVVIGFGRRAFAGQSEIEGERGAAIFSSSGMASL